MRSSSPGPTGGEEPGGRPGSGRDKELPKTAGDSEAVRARERRRGSRATDLFGGVGLPSAGPEVTVNGDVVGDQPCARTGGGGDT